MKYIQVIRNPFNTYIYLIDRMVILNHIVGKV